MLYFFPGTSSWFLKSVNRCCGNGSSVEKRQERKIYKRNNYLVLLIGVCCPKLFYKIRGSEFYVPVVSIAMLDKSEHLVEGCEPNVNFYALSLSAPTCE